MVQNRNAGFMSVWVVPLRFDKALKLAERKAREEGRVELVELWQAPPEWPGERSEGPRLMQWVRWQGAVFTPSPGLDVGG